jgi:Rieske Fe-S protein
MEESRRSFLDTLMWTSLAATAGACLAPVPFYLVPPALPPVRSRVVAGRRDEFTPGSARRVKMADYDAIVIHDGELRALDTRCTHQKCPVNWDAASMKFHCPCHGAIFDAKGEPVRGPHKGPLAALKLEITAGGDVIVSD